METTNPSLIAGIFRTQATADHAINELEQAGFREDQIRSTVYNLNEAQEAQGSFEHVPEQSRIVVTVIAEGREQEALGILVQNGANNADLPPGLVLEQGTLVNSQTETGTPTSEQEVDAAAGFSSDSFFGRKQVPDHP
jgi:hypothetical protein